MVLLPLPNEAFLAAMPARVLQLRLSKCLFRDHPMPPTASPLCCLLYLKNQHRNFQRRQGCMRSIRANERSSVRGSVRRTVAWPDSGVCRLPGPHTATQRRWDPVPPSPPGTTYPGSQTRPHMAMLGNRGLMIYKLPFVASLCAQHITCKGGGMRFQSSFSTSALLPLCARSFFLVGQSCAI